MEINFTFSAEDEVKVTERKWSREGEIQPPPRRNKVTLPKPNKVIEDEPVPLAEAPETGDGLYIVIGVIAAAIIALVIVLGIEIKKKKAAK